MGGVENTSVISLGVTSVKQQATNECSLNNQPPKEYTTCGQQIYGTTTISKAEVATQEWSNCYSKENGLLGLERKESKKEKKVWKEGKEESTSLSKVG